MKKLRSKSGKCLSKFDLAWAIHYNSDWNYDKSLPYYVYERFYSYQDMADAYISSNASFD